MKKWFKNPLVRLAGRALVAGLAVVATKYTGGTTDVHALEVAGILAFCEVFTPLNPIVGVFKHPGK